MTTEADAQWTWTKDGLTFWVSEHREHFNGYVRFPKRPTKERGYNGVLTYVPVHGGITWASEDADGSIVYGFDTNHACDDEIALKYPENYGGREAVELHLKQIRDAEWLGMQCHLMAEAILALAEVEDAYLLAEGDNAARANIIDPIWDRLSEKFKDTETWSFGVMLNMLSRRL